jgi:elongation factor P--(R)-beta-lysine ligase
VPSSWQPTASIKALQQRAQLYAALRSYFETSNSLEVQTPSLSASATTDPHVDSFSVNSQVGQLWLHTSPEFPMKRLLAAYPQHIHQFCIVFRDDEISRHHNREFTLLEWYRVNYSLEQLIDDAVNVVNTACQALGHTELPHQIVSYQEAVKELTGRYPEELSPKEIQRFFTQHNRSFPDSLVTSTTTPWPTQDTTQAAMSDTSPDTTPDTTIAALDDALTLLVDEFLVREFPQDVITVLRDYPASQASLARVTDNEQGIAVALRAELFLGSVELANGFEELTDGAEQSRRFALDNNARMAMGKPSMPVDELLLAALQSGLPACSGMAMGIDRLLMVLTGRSDLAAVLAFPGDHA